MKTLQYLLLCAAVSIAIFMVAHCHMDHGIEPLPGALHVRVAFRNEPPENTQGIYLIVAPKFPPHAINELYQSPNSISIDDDTVDAVIELPYGHYEAYGIWWYGNDLKSNLADILEMPYSHTTGLTATLDITPEEPVVERQLLANWDRVKRDAFIKGTISFIGDAPENTRLVAIAAFDYKPVEVVQYLAWLKSVDFSIDINDNPHDYTLPVRHGFIGYIAMFWLAEQAGLNEIKIVGSYKNPNNPDADGWVFISEGQTVTGVDVTVDWSVLENLQTVEQLHSF